jgi:nicotinamidase-related amidase
MKKIIIWIAMVLVLIVVVLGGNLVLFEKQALKITQGTPIKKYSAVKSALLVIDFQEYTTGQLSADTCYTNVSGNLFPIVNQIIDSAQVRSMPVVYVKSEVSDFLVNLINNSMAAGSAGVALDRRMNIVSDYIVPKQKQDAFSNTRLDSILIANEVSKLYISGLDAAFCVNSTIQAAQNRGYAISVMEDVILSKSDSLKTKLLAEYASRGVEIISSDKFFNTK